MARISMCRFHVLRTARSGCGPDGAWSTSRRLVFRPFPFKPGLRALRRRITTEVSCCFKHGVPADR